MKRGNIVINNLDELVANIFDQKAKVEYFYVSKGIQINPKAIEAPKYSNTGSSVLDRESKIDL